MESRPPRDERRSSGRGWRFAYTTRKEKKVPQPFLEIWPRAGGSRMTVCGGKIGFGNEKTAVEICRKNSAVPDSDGKTRYVDDQSC